MDSVIIFFKENIQWLKNLFTLFLALIASVISILTYLKAKKTVLQPLRSEVIKKQIELMSNLLEIISDQQKLLFQCDYYNILDLNLKKYLLEIGYTNKSLQSTKKQINIQEAGGLLCVDDDEEIHAFHKAGEKPKKNYEEYQKLRFAEAKNGEFKIQLVYYTNQYSVFLVKLNNIYNSPFINKQIKLDLEIILNKCRINLIKKMKNTIEHSINDFVRSDDKSINTEKYYNEFVIDSVPISDYIISIISKIRKLLKIDEKW